MNRLLLASLAVALLALSGCAVTDAAIRTAQTAAVGNDRYHVISTQILDGSVDEENGPPVTSEDLAATPKSVKEFLKKLLGALHVNRKAWHSVAFQLDVGPDPKTLLLDPVALPDVPDENDDLLDDE